MQSELPNPDGSHSESYRPKELTEFLQDNWVYLAIVVIIISIVVIYTKILRDRKKNKVE